MPEPIEPVVPVWAAFYCDETAGAYHDPRLLGSDPEHHNERKRWYEDLDEWFAVRNQFMDVCADITRPIVLTIHQVWPPVLRDYDPDTDPPAWLSQDSQQWLTGLWIDYLVPWQVAHLFGLGLEDTCPQGWVSGVSTLHRNPPDAATLHNLYRTQNTDRGLFGWWFQYARFHGWSDTVPEYAEELWHPTIHYIDGSGSMTRADLQPGYGLYMNEHGIDPIERTLTERWVQSCTHFLRSQLP
jgi:hypothetical protein